MHPDRVTDLINCKLAALLDDATFMGGLRDAVAQAVYDQIRPELDQLTSTLTFTGDTISTATSTLTDEIERWSAQVDDARGRVAELETRIRILEGRRP